LSPHKQGYPIEYANNVKRVHYQHTRAEQDHLNKASSLERVKLTICPVKDLLPDEDARIFIKVRVFFHRSSNLR